MCGRREMKEEINTEQGVCDIMSIQKQDSDRHTGSEVQVQVCMFLFLFGPFGQRDVSQDGVTLML